MYSRTVANYVFDAIARVAVSEFAADASVHIKIEAQTVKFFFRGGVFARFKKGDEHKLGQNIPTQAALAFISPEGFLPGLPPETAKVEFIWLANDIQTRLEHVLVVARDNERLLWEYEIEPGESGSGTGTIVPFPPSPTSPGGPDDERLVKPKSSDIKKIEKE